MEKIKKIARVLKKRVKILSEEEKEKTKMYGRKRYLNSLNNNS